MSPPRVAHVLSSFGMGGQERVALDLARLQQHSGQRVLAVSLAPDPQGPTQQAFRQAGVATEVVSKQGPSVDAGLPVRLARVLRRHGVDVVHTHNPHALVYGSVAAKLAGCALVHTKHGVNPNSERRRWLLRGVARLADAYVAVTESLARVALDRRECQEQLLRVIPNGIDVRRFRPDPVERVRARANLGIPAQAWVVGSVGRLAPEKDQHALIDAIAPMLDERRHLVLVGDGPERDALQARAVATWRPELVHFTGARDDVAELLSAFDLFALTSRTEGLPLVLLEAMAVGVPVLATDVGGVPDVVQHGVTGYLVQAGDRPALTRQLAWLAARPQAASEVAEQARKRVVSRHSSERMMQDYAELYDGVRARGRRPARHAPAHPP